MPIDWFTVVAQVINFLILVWLLKRFLFKPILSAIDAREKGIAAQLAEAEAKKADSQKERDDFEHKNEAFDKERATLLQKATDDASAERQRLFDEARHDADTLRVKRQEALVNEQGHLSQEIIRWTREEVFTIARKTLADLANASLEERMCDVFVQRLRSMAGTDQEQLVTAITASSQSVHVRSAFDLPPVQRAVIESAIKQSVRVETQIQFETVPELVGGIELSANGQKIAWSIADYLTTLEKDAAELLHENAKLKSKPAPTSSPGTEATSDPEHKPEAQAGPKSEPHHEPSPAILLPKAAK